MADAKTWAKRVTAWRASGQTAAEFCGRRGYTLSSLQRWSHRLGREAAAETGVRLARVVRTSGENVPSSESAPSGAGPAIVIEVGGARVVVQRGVDRATVAAVLDALGGGR
jgi:transposase